MRKVFNKIVLVIAFCVLPISVQASVDIEVKFKDSRTKSAYFKGLSSKLKKNTATSNSNDFKLISVYTSAKASELLTKKNISSDILDKKLEDTGLANIYRINCDEDCNSRKLLKKLSFSGLFEYVEKDEPLDIRFQTVDPLLVTNGSIWNKAYKESWYLDAIRAKEAWAKTTGANTIVAVIDTGILVNHPDLAKQIWVDTTKVSDLNRDGLVNVLDMDKNRDGVITISDQPGLLIGELITGSIGRDFLDEVRGPSIVYSEDTQGHGTFIAGIIAAEKDNGKGLSGIVPNSKILSLATSRGNFKVTSLQIADYIKYAVDKGADVINISSSWTGDYSSIKSSLDYAVANDVIVVVSAGNDGIDSSDAIYKYPHTYSTVISVGSVDFNNTLSYFSNYGTAVDVLAPGENIISTVSSDQEMYSPSKLVGSLDESKHGYITSNGTSFSSPIVASAVAMLKSLEPSISFESVLNILKNTSNTAFSSRGKTFTSGVGILDLSKMVNEYQKYLLTTPTFPLGGYVNQSKYLATTEETAKGKLILSNDTVVENKTVIGYFSVQGGDYGSYVHTLLGGDISNFVIEYRRILSASPPLDYETKSSYNLTVRTTDPTGKFFDTDIVIRVLDDTSSYSDPNDKSISVKLSNDSIGGNLPIGTKVGDIDGENIFESNYNYSVIEGGEYFEIKIGSIVVPSPVLVSKKSFDYATQKEYKIKIRLTSKTISSLFIDREYTIKILPPTPQKLILSANSIIEGKSDIVGFLSVRDGDYSRYTYTLVGGDIAVFETRNSDRSSALYASQALDYETKSSYNLTVRATATDGKFFDTDIVVRVLDNTSSYSDPNDKSISVKLSNDSIGGNLPIGTKVGDIDGENILESNYNYSVIEGGEYFEIKAGPLSYSLPVLVSKKSFDYATQKEYKIKIRLTSKIIPSLFIDREYTIKILDQVVSESKGKLILSNNTITEIFGSLVGFFSVQGGNYTSYVYTLVRTGDFASFQIKDRNFLYALQKLDYETKSSYNLTVRATATDGKFFDTDIVVRVLDNTSSYSDPNDKSISVKLSNDSIDENLAIGTKVGDIDGENIVESNYNYSVIEGGEYFEIKAGSLSYSLPVLISKKSFDYEAQKDYKVKLRLTYKEDPSMFLDREYIIKILNQVSESNGTDSDPDEDYSFTYNSSNSLSLSSQVGTELGTFVTDSGRSLSVYLLGSPKAKKLFSIVNNKLILKKTLGLRMKGQRVYLRVQGVVDGNTVDDVYLTVIVN